MKYNSSCPAFFENLLVFFSGWNVSFNRIIQGMFWFQLSLLLFRQRMKNIVIVLCNNQLSSFILVFWFHLTMFCDSKVYQTLPFNPFNLVNQFNVVYLNYSSIPAWNELGPAQSQLVTNFFILLQKFSNNLNFFIRLKCS